MFTSGKKMSMAPTARQQEIMNFIGDFHHRMGMPPTIREIAAHFKIKSPNGVLCHLESLEKKGLVKRHHLATNRTTGRRSSLARGIMLAEIGMNPSDEGLLKDWAERHAVNGSVQAKQVLELLAEVAELRSRCGESREVCDGESGLSGDGG